MKNIYTLILLVTLISLSMGFNDTNNTYIAVGGFGGNRHILRSTDLENWTPITSISGTGWTLSYSVAYGNGTWVITGDGSTFYGYPNSPIIYSIDDGLTWHKANINVNTIQNFETLYTGYRVSWNGDIFLAVGRMEVMVYGSILMTPMLQSTDGINWSPVTAISALGTAGNNVHINDVNWINGQWYTVFRDAVYTAGPGSNPTWTSHPVSFYGCSRIAGSANHRIYVLFSGPNTLVYSTDGGVTWSDPIPSPLSEVTHDMRQFGDSGMVMVGDSPSGPIVYTTDFVNWYQASGSSSIGDLGISVYADGTTFLAGGMERSGNLRPIGKSTNGINWTSILNPPNIQSGPVRGFAVRYGS